MLAIKANCAMTRSRNYSIAINQYIAVTLLADDARYRLTARTHTLHHNGELRESDL